MKKNKRNMKKTVFRYKGMNVRNNIKSAMIDDLVHTLSDNATDVVEEQREVTTETVNYQSELFSACAEDKVSCLNPDCEWIYFMRIFYTKKPFLLPATGPESNRCVFCESRDIDYSKVKISSHGDVVV